MKEKHLSMYLCIKIYSMHSFFALPGCRDTGNNFFVSQISGGSVTFPGTRNVG